ncbi:MAG: M15 family metallopeptidase [Micavibrio sp.]
MHIFHGEPYAINLVYAAANHAENIFGIAAYHSAAPLILHRDLARIVILTSRILHRRHGWALVLKDGLRPVEAQQALMDSEIARQNPQWLADGAPRLLSPPGQGAHPRGMAVDVGVAGIDFGTGFDEMTAQSARAYTGFDADIIENRAILEQAFMEAAEKLSLPLLPLPSEWWDFRFPAAYYQVYAPLGDRDLPPALRMIEKAPHTSAGNDAPHFDKLAKEVLNSLPLE